MTINNVLNINTSVGFFWYGSNEKEIITGVKNEISILIEQILSTIDIQENFQMILIKEKMLKKDSDFKELFEKYIIAQGNFISNKSMLLCGNNKVIDLLIQILKLYNNGDFKKAGELINDIYEIFNKIPDIAILNYELLKKLKETIEDKQNMISTFKIV